MIMLQLSESCDETNPECLDKTPVGTNGRIMISQFDFDRFKTVLNETVSLITDIQRQTTTGTDESKKKTLESHVACLNANTSHLQELIRINENFRWHDERQNNRALIIICLVMVCIGFLISNQLI